MQHKFQNGSLSVPVQDQCKDSSPK